MKKYAVKKIFGPTIQGEGRMTGTVSHFVRFSGCNMWDGRPETKATSQCVYCDTDFFGGEKLTAEEIVAQLKALPECKWVTLSGGEPALQIDDDLLTRIHKAGFYIAVETNGTVDISDLVIDHVTCSPKTTPDKIKLVWCDTLKLLYPHPFLTPEMFKDFPCGDRYLQTLMDDNYVLNVMAIIKYLKEAKGHWKFSFQVHKEIGVE